MARYIDADALIVEHSKIEIDGIAFKHSWDEVYKNLRKAIENAPTADVEEVRHGHWSRGTEPSGSVYAHCSACNRKMNYSCYGYARCSLCGAKMDGGKEE